MSTSGNTRSGAANTRSGAANTRPGAAALSATMLRRRIVWTVVLVLAALGGAGLATAADRLPTDASRPELTWHADRLVGPRIQAMGAQVSGIGEDVDRLADAGRAALSLLPGLEPARIEQALAAGDEAAARLRDEIELLLDMRAEQFELVADERLSQANRDLLAAIDDAITAVDPLPQTWSEMAADARLVTRLLESLVRHDGLVFRATNAGRQGDWQRALELLDEARSPLDEARAVRDALSEQADVSTLDELLNRYAEYDDALVALYQEIDQGGAQDSPEVEALLAEVERTQAALPPNNDALRIVVADAAGPSVARGLVEVEQARGAVAFALSLLAGEAGEAAAP